MKFNIKSIKWCHLVRIAEAHQYIALNKLFSDNTIKIDNYRDNSMFSTDKLYQVKKKRWKSSSINILEFSPSKAGTARNLKRELPPWFRLMSFWQLHITCMINQLGKCTRILSSIQNRVVNFNFFLKFRTSFFPLELHYFPNYFHFTKIFLF